MRNRRDLLKLLVAGGVLAPAASAAMQDQGTLTTEILERAVTLFDTGIEPARIRDILPAVQRNSDFFRIVRDLPLEDDIEPSPIFQADRSGGP